jgi:restriction endonuclease
MNPLCTLRYSATHADKHHMVFRLDAVDAYQYPLINRYSRFRAKGRDTALRYLA